MFDYNNLYINVNYYIVSCIITQHIGLLNPIVLILKIDYTKYKTDTWRHVHGNVYMAPCAVKCD